MPRIILLTAALILFTTSLAHAGAKEEVQAAAKKVQDSGYSWTTEVEGGSGTKQEGKMLKDGLTMLVLSSGDIKVEAVFKEGKGAINTVDGWQTLDEAKNGRAKGIVRIIQNLKGPAKEAIEMAGKAPDLQHAGEIYSADMPDDWTLGLLFGRRPSGDGIEVKDVKGSTKFWVKDGLLTRLEYHTQATLTINGKTRAFDRTTKTEFKDVGATTIEIPAGAKGKMD